MLVQREAAGVAASGSAAWRGPHNARRRQGFCHELQIWQVHRSPDVEGTRQHFVYFLVNVFSLERTKFRFCRCIGGMISRSRPR